MKKIILLFTGLGMLFIIACKETAKAPEQTAGTSSASFKTEGAEVDLLKKLMKAYESGDWTSYRSCFSDTAASYYNNWPLDTNAEKVPIDSVVANHKLGRETMWDGMSINEPIYEAVTDSTGYTYGHVWAKLSTKKKKSGEPVDITVFGSYGIKNGKVDYEWVIFDRSKLD